MDSAIDLVKNLIDEGRTFQLSNAFYVETRDSFSGGGYHAYAGERAEWSAWKTRVLNAVKKFSSEDSSSYSLAKQGTTRPSSLDDFEKAQTRLLKSLELLMSALQEDVYSELRKTESTNSSPTLSNRIFIVHGHDSGLKTDVERFVREIGLEPVVLHRQVDAGGTIIEKFEKHSDVGYAFILLTPDEVAYTVDQSGIEDSQRIKEYRARPNVIFEFGYFVGRLGRSRVCCLHKGEVKVPSDLDGLVYKKIDSSIDPQAYAIIRELKAAGYQISV